MLHQVDEDRNKKKPLHYLLISKNKHWKFYWKKESQKTQPPKQTQLRIWMIHILTETPHIAFHSLLEDILRVWVERTFTHRTEACLKPFIEQAMHCAMVKDTDALWKSLKIIFGNSLWIDEPGYVPSAPSSSDCLRENCLIAALGKGIPVLPKMSCLIVNIERRQDPQARPHPETQVGLRWKHRHTSSWKTFPFDLAGASDLGFHCSLVRALFIKAVLKDSHSYLWAQDLGPGPFQWCSCFRAPLAQDCGCVSVFVGLVPSSSPGSLSHDLMIKSLFSFTVCLPWFTGSF